jgi:fermentation-respiration switch protein FrsA (DUF1100 family)
MVAGSVSRRLGQVLTLVTLRSAFWQRSWKHRLARLGGYGAYAYVAILLTLVALEDRILYQAQDAGVWEAPPSGVQVLDVDLTSADGTRIHAWWSTPKGWEPGQGAVLFCHGNAGNLSYRGDALRPWLEELRLAVLLFDYPGFGRSGGAPGEAGCYAAGDAAYDWLARVQKVPEGRIVLYGGSLGGGVATDLAARVPCRALVLASTFTSVPDMAQETYPWLPGRWLVRNRFDNLAKIGRCRGPVFIAHGTRDGLIPFRHGERLFAAAPGPKHFCAMTDFGHNDSPTPEVYPALRRFLDQTDVETRPAGTPPTGN